MLSSSLSFVSDSPDYRILEFGSLDSTNSEAVRRSSSDAGNLWIRSSCQTSGRGRHGRAWTSPVGNLYCSLLLKDVAPVSLLSTLPLVSCIALHRSLSFVSGVDVSSLKIKWPNDILYNSKKLSGILLESGVSDLVSWVVLGFGVNCVSHPDNISATSLSAEGIEASPDLVFDNLVREVSLALSEWDSGSGFGVLRDYWLCHCSGLGGRISVSTDSASTSGIFESIDDSGRLVLLGDDGVRHYIMSGDVFF